MHAEELHRLELDIAADGDRVNIAIEGELDTTTAPRLITTTHDLLDGTVARVEVNCDGVWFLDSAGLRALIVARNEAIRRGVDFAIVRASLTVTRILDVTGLTATLTSTSAN